MLFAILSCLVTCIKAERGLCACGCPKQSTPHSKAPVKPCKTCSPWLAIKLSLSGTHQMIILQNNHIFAREHWHFTQ